MLCPSCRSKSAVFDSRAFDRTTRRGRKCLDCGHRFRTIEVLHGRKPSGPRKKGGKPSRGDVVVATFEKMSDEELEAAIFEDGFQFDEDEL
jgi:transcriptional regulator NrdR family protein